MTAFRKTLLLACAALAFAGSLHAQEPRKAPGGKKRDLQRMSPQQRHFYLSAQRGADWLQKRNRPDGRFIYGFSPALGSPLEEDSYLGQVEAAFALGRAARFFGDPRAAAIARQAVLTCLADTTVEDKTVRHTIPPSNFVNRAAAAGLLVQAIHELPDAKDDVLKQADELCNFLERRLRSDGSVSLTDDGQPASAEDVECFSGPALLGIIRSQHLRPAPWKIEALRKGRGYYQARWRERKNFPMLPEHTAASAEAFAVTRDRAFAEFVFEMNDWLCTHQYVNMDPRRESWTGGFPPWVDGKPAPLPPDIRSATAAQSLADACRTAHLAGDLARHKRYTESLESCLKFLTTLQYTEANTQHFAEWYRPLLVGGFHASPRDGDLRLDYTQRSVAALVQYLSFVNGH